MQALLRVDYNGQLYFPTMTAAETEPMFQQSGPGPFDLRWRMFGISFCIKFSFWVAWLLIGLYIDFDLGKLLLWMPVVVVSFFVHELAHAIVGRLFGARTAIVIGAFGGTPTGHEALKRWQRVLFYAAGPAASFAVWAGVEAYRFHGNPFLWGGNAALFILRAVVLARNLNFFIACFNLLPIYPLDLGMIVRETSEAVSPRRGLMFSLIVSFLCAGGLAIYVGVTYWEQIRLRNLFVILFLVFDTWLAIQSLILLFKVLREREPHPDDARLDESEQPQAKEENYDDYRPYDGGRPYDSEKR